VLSEARRHERGGLLVADADVANAILALAQGLDDRIYAVADNAEDVRRAPIDQSFDQDVRCVQVIARQRRWLGRERFVCFRRCSREVFDRGDRREAGDRCSLENIPPQKPCFSNIAHMTPPVCELTPAMRVGFIARPVFRSCSLRADRPARRKAPGRSAKRRPGKDRERPHFNAAVLDFFASRRLGQIGFKAW